MARITRVFLDADNLRVELAKLCERFNISFGEESQGFGRVLSELPEKLPAADVRPERYGRWILDDSDEYVNRYHCSKCGAKIATCNEIYDEPPPNYCEHCGAKMDGKDDRDEDEEG